jgi:hypothetical protein
MTARQDQDQVAVVVGCFDQSQNGGDRRFAGLAKELATDEHR